MFIAEGRAGQTCQLVIENPSGPSKRRKTPGSCQQQRSRSLSPFLRRVGGGYDYIYPKVPFNDDLFCSSPADRKGLMPALRFDDSAQRNMADQAGGEMLLFTQIQYFCFCFGLWLVFAAFHSMDQGSIGVLEAYSMPCHCTQCRAPVRTL